ncbi:MAG: hypothetical protein EG822_12370 [Deltaproteobacteria bacterium]|nr:hypothetical protein [Deltaproteobacteria bacterium]TLN03763.1 MAG: hypothetical protein FDZ73_06150 [bacterium]
MARLPGNRQLTDAQGNSLFTLKDINTLQEWEKERIYGRIVPDRLLSMFNISSETFQGRDGERKVFFTAPEGLGLCRIEMRLAPLDRDAVFYLEIADTQHHQMELAFCIINDPFTPRFNVDVDEHDRNNCFTSYGRNIPEEIRAMKAGLFPNQTHRGLRMFPDFLPLFEFFVDSLGMEFIIAEPLTYDNAIRYEKYGFDYLTGKRLMLEINEGFRNGNIYQRRLDGSSPFRCAGAEKTVHGRSWAIHDGILEKPWDDIRIYLQIGHKAGIDTFPEKA